MFFFAMIGVHLSLHTMQQIMSTCCTVCISMELRKIDIYRMILR